VVGQLEDDLHAVQCIAALGLGCHVPLAPVLVVVVPFVDLVGGRVSPDPGNNAHRQPDH